MKKVKEKYLAGLMAFCLLLACFNGSAEATLIDQGNGIILDNDLNIYWLKDAHHVHNSGYLAGGLLFWSEAIDYIDWLNNTEYLGFQDWRLPSALETNGNYPICAGQNCTDSEMGHLYYIELKNVASSTYPEEKNVGPFLELQTPYSYWTGTLSPDGLSAWDFSFAYGSQNCYLKDDNKKNVWAVRGPLPSDIYPVPEPATILLFGSGLMALITLRLKRSDLLK